MHFADELYRYVNIEKSIDNFNRIVNNQVQLGYDRLATIEQLQDEHWWLVSKFSDKQLEGFLKSLTSGKENCCGGKIRYADKQSALNTKYGFRNDLTDVYWCPYCNFWHIGHKRKAFDALRFEIITIYPELEYIKDKALKFEIERYLLRLI